MCTQSLGNSISEFTVVCSYFLVVGRLGFIKVCPDIGAGACPYFQFFQFLEQQETESKVNAVDQLITCHLHMTNETAPSPNELDYGLYFPGSGRCVFIVCHQGRELSSIVQAWARIYEICLIR